MKVWPVSEEGKHRETSRIVDTTSPGRKKRVEGAIAWLFMVLPRGPTPPQKLRVRGVGLTNGPGAVPLGLLSPHSKVRMVRVWGSGGVEPADLDMLCGQDKDSAGRSWLSGWQWIDPGHPGSDVAPGARAKQEIPEQGHPQGEGKE